jgi:nicotinamidase-related amidase
MQRPALIVIDMVNDFLEKWSPGPRQQLVRSINELVGLMRQRCHPIIWVRQEFEADLRDAFPEMKAKVFGSPSRERSVARLLQTWQPLHRTL